MLKNKTGDVFEEWAWVFFNFEKIHPLFHPNWIMIWIDMNIDYDSSHFINLAHESVTYDKLIFNYGGFIFVEKNLTKIKKADFINNFNLVKDISINFE